MIIPDSFVNCALKTNIVISHMNRLDEAVHMRDHNIWFQ